MNSDLGSWNEAAANWDRNIAQAGSYRTILLEQGITKTLGEVSGKKILDAGCGNGFFTNWLAGKGARVVGIDGSSRMVALAKENFPQLEFQEFDLLKQTALPAQSFDAILANMLLMHLSDVRPFLGEAKRLLKPGGQLVFSILHPAFNEPTSTLRKTLWEKLAFAKPRAEAYSYYQTGKGRYEAHMRTGLTHYHRTLEGYSEYLRGAGFAITSLCEPHDLPEDFLRKNPKLEYATRLPRFIFFNCKLQ